MTEVWNSGNQQYGRRFSIGCDAFSKFRSKANSPVAARLRRTRRISSEAVSCAGESR